MGLPLREVRDHGDYELQRERTSVEVVEFISSLQADEIPDYVMRPVYVNRALDLSAGPVDRESEERQNAENNNMNELQMAVSRELKYLKPKVIQFLESNYGSSEEERQELARLLARMERE